MTKLVLTSNDVTEKLNINNDIKLYSITRKIDLSSPLLFYIGNKSYYPNESFFWKSPDENFILVGFGAQYKMNYDDNHQRYKEIEEIWLDISRTAEIENSYELHGTGPLLFGGFSFDTLKDKEDEWKNFAESFFYLPTYLLSVHDGESFITVNYFGENKPTNKSVDEQIDELLMRTAKEVPKQSIINKKEEIDVNKWLETVNDVVNQFEDESLKKVVLARKLNLQFNDNLEIGAVLNQLLMQQPNSFIFSLQAKQSHFIGASPERLVKKINDKVYSTSLAGSIGRGNNEEEDEKFAEWLFNDKKNRFEHDVVISMIKNVLEPHCKNVYTPDIPMIMKTPDIQHLYTPVEGIIKEGHSLLQIVEGLHPTPALGGVPTDRAKSIIREKEGMNRGLYASPIGWMDYRMNGEFVVAIRCGLFEENEGYLFAGCGLVKGSKSEDELIETRIKFQPMLRALKGESE